MSVTIAVATEQLPVAENVTGSPEDAVALIAKGGSPKILFGRAPKSIVWAAWALPRRYTVPPPPDHPEVVVPYNALSLPWITPAWG